MKKQSLIVATLSLGAMSAYAAQEITPSDVTCASLAERYQLTAEGRERLANLIGSCESVVEIDGALYVTTQAVVRSAGSRTVRLYLPATDRTFEVAPDPDLRVNVAGRKVRPRDLERGQEITIHVAVDKVAEPIPLDSIALATEPAADTGAEPIVEHLGVTEIAALPTTASPVPAITLVGLSLLGLSAVFRRLRRT